MADARIIPLHPVPGADTAALVLDEVHLARGGRPLLRGVSLRLARHGITALIGPNGAGKSLLLRAIAGLVPVDRGAVVLSPDLGDPAVVFQRPVLLRRSVRGNLDHALKIAGVSRRDRPGRIAELLVLASLSQRSEVPARRLSGGEQQRLQMARALAPRPACLLLDEPTASLDPASTAAIEALVRRIADDGVKVILVTHDRAQAKRLAGDVAFLHKGRVTEHRAAAEFFDTPASPEADAYLSGRLLV